MKKQYIKPMLAVEYYELTQAIAACATKFGLMDSACVLNDADATDQMKDLAYVGFFIEAGGCGAFPEGMDASDAICYHTNANSAFTS